MRTAIAGALLAAVALPACSAVGAGEAVAVSLEHSRFVLDRSEFRSGETVTFVIRNTDPIDHEFILGDHRVQAVHENGTGHHHGDIPGEISVAAGEELTTTYTFPHAGTLIIGCHLPGHYDYGMRTEVRVTG